MSATARKISRTDHYQELTDSVIAALEIGVKPWSQGGDPNMVEQARPIRSMPINGVTGRRYRGINVLVLSMSAIAHGGDPRWCTYRQAAAKGWQVKGGSKATTVFFFKKLTVEDKNAPAGSDDPTKTVPMLKTFHVFNAAQIDGIPAFAPPTIAACPWRRPEAASVIVENSKLDLRIGGERAFYSASQDFVQMPPDGAFRGPEFWASTLLHEMGHWTSHKSRLDRDITSDRSLATMAQEELRAELASLFMGAELDLPCEIESHVNYIGSWLQALRNDKREIFHAAADAQRISDYLLNFHPDYAAAAAAEAALTPANDE